MERLGDVDAGHCVVCLVAGVAHGLLLTDIDAALGVQGPHDLCELQGKRKYI